MMNRSKERTGSRSEVARRTIALVWAVPLVWVACGGEAVPDDAATADAVADRERDIELVVSEGTEPELRDEHVEEVAIPPAPPTPAPELTPPPAAHPPHAAAPSQSAAPEAERAPDPVSETPAAEEAAPEPAYSEWTAEAGETFRIRLRQELSTATNRPGDLFTAVTDDVLIDESGNFVVLPRGALVRGEITAVRKSGGSGEPAVIKVDLYEVYFEAESYPLYATVIDADVDTRGRYTTEDKAIRIGGGAGAGAILGAILGKGKGAVIGAAIGAAAGTAITLATEDVDAVLPEGAYLTLRLDEPLIIKSFTR